MHFSNISNSQKIELLKLKQISVEEKLYAAIIEAGFIPEEFEIESFETIFASLSEEDFLGKYSTYDVLNEVLQHYLKLNDNLNLLKRDLNEI